MSSVTTGSDLLEDKRFLVVRWVDAVGRNYFRAVLLPHRVRGQSVHLHLHVRTNLLVSQELTRDHLM